MFYEDSQIDTIDNEIDVLLSFFHYAKTEEFNEQIYKVLELIQQADTIHFIGIGTNGTLGEYGARYFSNIGYIIANILKILIIHLTSIRKVNVRIY